jgi:uncharacterized membrane protein YphA (DoxX/SURF4 family)
MGHLAAHWALTDVSASRIVELLSEPTLALLLLTRTVVGVVLIVASVPKLTASNEFIQVVQGYQLVPDKFAVAVGRILPVMELAAGLGLVSGIFMPWSSLLAILLFILFGFAISLNLLRGRRYIPCGCFGMSREGRLSWGSVLRNVILSALAFSSRGAPISFRCLSLRGCTPNPMTVLPVAQTITIMISSVGFVSLWWLYGTIRKILTLPGRETYFPTEDGPKSGVETQRAVRTNT